MKRRTIEKILVPIDFSPISIQAIETAKHLAQRFGATIHLVHVHQSGYPTEFRPLLLAGQLPESFQEQSAEQLAEALKRVASKAPLPPRGKTHLRTGASAFYEICKLAQELPADLIVMPTHGYTGLKHLLLGSTAERVVQHSPCPVFVVRQPGKRPAEGKPGYKQFLVPVDFSGCSRGGLRSAIGLANEFGARIILLHATYLGYIYSSEGTAMYDVRGLQEATRENAEGQMRKIVRAVKFGDVKFETAFTDGSPVLDICSFAKDHDVDLIITSTHGLTGFQHVLIGSVAEKVVRHAPCSVLVVPSHPKIRMASLAKPRARKPRTVRGQPQARKSLRGKALTKRDRKLATHVFPERRKTNKFRESHFSDDRPRKSKK